MRQNMAFSVFVASHALPSGSKVGDWTAQTPARLLKRFQSGILKAGSTPEVPSFVAKTFWKFPPRQYVFFLVDTWQSCVNEAKYGIFCVCCISCTAVRVQGWRLDSPNPCPFAEKVPKWTVKSERHPRRSLLRWKTVGTQISELKKLNYRWKIKVVKILKWKRFVLTCWHGLLLNYFRWW